MTEEEYLSLIGDKSQRLYVQQLYQNEIAIDDVPADLRDAVQATVNNRIDRWGAYEDQPVSTKELREFVESLGDKE